MAYVCSLTRYSINYVQFFKGDGQSLNNASATTRSSERKEKLRKKKIVKDEKNAGMSMSSGTNISLDPL